MCTECDLRLRFFLFLTSDLPRLQWPRSLKHELPYPAKSLDRGRISLYVLMSVCAFILFVLPCV
jgi:hypothetical protein